MTPGTPSSSGSSYVGDFDPGQVLIGRYRIIALVGEGGMGQVYLADDLVLGQSVALKFLPPHLAEREGGLDRFRAEVRHAREVTHPNVARVHDIGEVAGRHFLTMEYVDGEDLASLVKRIGRLPREKAAEIAQQICAGLAEAHQRGVLHRDLKPANVMLDGEGRVKLTDFGLAVSAAAGDDAGLAGTPAYMAPEQLAGLPATPRSEVDSLGLVLYELYTGKRALRGRTIDELRREHEQGPPGSVTSLYADIDPQVDAMLARCLARDPKERPESVREVARGLPGGDPLAAALAQGRTPEPALVAAADAGGALSPRAGLVMAVGFVALFLAFSLLRTWFLEHKGQVATKAPAVLDERARDAVAVLTGAEPPPFEVHWFDVDREWNTDPAASGGAPPLDLQPLVRISRFAPESIRPSGISVAMDNPQPSPGSIVMSQDARGRLLSWTFRAPSVPAEDASTEEVPAAVDWTRLLALAGVDPSTVVPAEPEFVPRVFADQTRAWTLPGGAWRLQAAALGGRPVQFDVVHRDAQGVEHAAGWIASGPSGGFALFILILTTVAAAIAWRNVRGKRAYLAGALVVGAYEAAAHLLTIFTAPVPTDLYGFMAALYDGLSMSLHVAFRVFVFFLALEPFARRRWPGALISWTRMLEGRLRDPAVGREVLVGLSVGLLVVTLLIGGGIVLDVTGVQDMPVGNFLSPATLGGPLQSACHLVHELGDTVMYGGIALFLLVALRTLVRQPWLGNALWVVAFAALMTSGEIDSILDAVAPLTLLLVFLALLTRFGFLAVVAFLLAMAFTSVLPVTLQPDDPAFASGVLTLLAFTGLVTWAYRTAVGGRSAFA